MLAFAWGRWKSGRILAAVATLAFYGCATAQLLDLAHRVWRAQDGLPDQVVQAVCEGADHYLWVGTTRGLWRFDGETFTPYSGPFADALRHGVTSLTVARDGGLWIGTEGNGLFQMRRGAMQSFGAAQGLLNPIVRAVKEDAHGTMWVGTDLGIYRSNGQHFEIPLPTGPPRGIGSAALFADANGRVYSGGTKLLRFDGEGYREIAFPQQKEPLRIKALVDDGDGGLWIGTLTGMFHMDRDEKVRRAGPATTAIRMLGRLRDGATIAGTAGDGLLLEKGGGFRNVASDAIGLPSDTVLSESTDANGNVWIGTQGGLVRLSHTGVHAAGLSHGSTADLAGLMQDSDGSLWYSSRRVFHGRDGKWASRDFAFLEGARVRTLFRDREGGLWLATAGADAYRIGRDGQAKHVDGLGASYVRAFLEGRDGTIWIGTDSGVAAYRNGAIANFYTTPAAPHTLVLSLAEGRDGSLWIGSQRGLFHLRSDGKYEALPPGVATRDEAIWSLLSDDAGALWIGSDKGLSRLANGNRTAVALRGDVQTPAVYQLLSGPDGVLWIAGATQILLVEKRALEQVAAGQTLHVAMQRFSPATDVPSAEVLSGVQPSAFVEGDGSAWFASSEGPLHIVPKERPAEVAVPMRITRVTVDGRSVSSDGTIELPPDSRTLEVGFAPIALGPQNTLEFRHRLVGFEGWSEAGQARSAVYTNLRPGTYRFEAELLGSGGQVLAQTPVLAVHQNAHFYQRQIFWWLIAAALALIAWGVHLLRVHELRMSYRAKTDERNRLAREMHDTVIQGCTAVSALLEASGATTDDPLLRYAQEQIRNTIEEAREAVWDLRTYDKESEPLVPALRRLAENATKGTAMQAEVESSAADIRLDHGVAHEALMATREAVLNAVAHSGGSAITIRVHDGDGNAHISIADNGRGFDPANTPGEDQQHYGLAGMRERMERVGGAFTVWTELDKGTRVELQVPIETRANRFKTTEER